jgi:hypothetical protein
MFCDQCGSQIQPGQNFCSHCGKAIAVPVEANHPRSGRVQEHVRLLGILWLALSALDGIQGVALYFVANILFNPFTHPDRPAFLHLLLSFVATVLVVKAFAGFATGWGLLRREPWARQVSLVLAFISLFFNIPFGTALGIYTLWVFLPSEAEREYEAVAQARFA